MAEQTDSRDDSTSDAPVGVEPEGFPVCASPFRPSDFSAVAAVAARAAGATIRFPPNQRIVVKPHVRAFADAAQAATGVASWGTYYTHHPTPERALDAFANKADGDALCQFALAKWGRFGLRYMMWWHHINYNDGRGWLWVEERGSPTDNHMDHVHLGFESEAPESEGDKLTVAQIDELNGRIDDLNGKIDELLSKTQFANDVLAEVKREWSETFGQPNWHQVGEAGNTVLGVIVNMLADIKQEVAEIKAAEAGK